MDFVCGQLLGYDGNSLGCVSFDEVVYAVEAPFGHKCPVYKDEALAGWASLTDCLGKIQPSYSRISAQELCL
jgi:hypothetical protein